MKTRIFMMAVIGLGVLASCSRKLSPDKFAMEWCAKYQKGVKFMEEKKYDEANASFEEMDRYYKEVTQKYADNAEFISSFKALSKQCADEHNPLKK